MPQGDFEETRAVAHLPNLQIEIIQSRSRAGDAERLSISMLAVPSFGAFQSYMETANPFLFWMRFAQTAWAPWLSGLPAMLPRTDFGGGRVSGQIAPPAHGHGGHERPKTAQ